MKLLTLCPGAAILLLAFGSAAAQPATGYVLGKNLFLSPAVARLAKTEGKINLGHDARIQCQPQREANGTVTVCYTRAELAEYTRTLVKQGDYLPGSDIVASPGVQAIVAREGHINPYDDSRVRCDVVNMPSSNMRVNYCQTVQEARVQHDAAVRLMQRARIMIQQGG